MKKFAKMLFTMVCILSLSCTALAEPSPEDPVEIVDAVDENGEPVDVTITDNDIPLITEIEAADVNKGEDKRHDKPEQLKVLWQKYIDFPADRGSVTMTINIAGADGRMLYAYYWDGTKWILIASGEGPELTYTLEAPGYVGIVLAVPDQSGEGGEGQKSPQTGAGIPAEAAALLLAGTGMALTYRKKQVF